MQRSTLLRRFVPVIVSVVVGSSLVGVVSSASASTLPSISSLSPRSGTTHGGTRVTVTGSRFAHVTAVLFGTARATSIRVVSSTTLVATAPSHAAGLVNVRVETRAGTSPVTTVDRYRYLPPTSCAFFRNGPGITSTTITIGNASDISGPSPGLFQASQDAVKAYVAYFNATSSICGRKLRLTTRDTQTSASGDQAAYHNLCTTSFAAVGSMATFDSAGASTAQSCGIPDIRAAGTSDAVHACTTCFAAQGSNPAYYETAPFTYFFDQNPSLKQHVAVAYLNQGGAAETANTIHGVLTKLGATNVDIQAIGASDLSYDNYVQSMANHGDQYVIFLGPPAATVRLQRAMQTNGFAPPVFIHDPSLYDPAYVQAAQQAEVGNGTYVFLNFMPFSQAASNHEESLYLTWLHHVAPSASSTSSGVFAWSAAALFAQQAVRLGGELNRANLVRSVRAVHSWTDNGMTAPQNVGGKINGSCWQFVRLENGSWQSVAGYRCDAVDLG